MDNKNETSRLSPRQFWQFFLLLSIVFSAIAIYQITQLVQGYIGLRFRAIFIVLAFNLGLGLFLLLRRDKNDELWQKNEISLNGILSKIFGAVLFFVGFPILWYIKFYALNEIVTPLFFVIWAWLWITLLQAFGLKLLTQGSWTLSFGIALLFGGITFQFWSILRPISDYPFSMGWSEISQFYDGSLPLSKAVYGVQLPLSFLDGSRYFLLSFPFLFKNPSLWASRLWQAFLWLFTNGLTAFLLVRRIKWQGKIQKLLVGGWYFLFLFQGAVYYHLLVCVIVVLAGISPRHFWRSLLAVMIASFWAGMSRVNWFPVSAMLAITIYLLEEPFSKNNNYWKYFQKLILWGLAGIAFALAGQIFYISISGNSDLSKFSSSFTSALLWYRWWPNDTNKIGIIPGVVIISLPVFLLLTKILKGYGNSLHPLRWLVISTMLVVLLAGGLIVSTKIGGGSNLHNLDAYIVMLGMITVYFLGENVKPEDILPPPLKMDMSFVMSFLLIIPVAFSLSHVYLPFQYDHKQAATDMQTLRTTVQSYSKDGEVLFIYERHLQTFGMIPGIPVVPEYEVVPLTEMAISGNQPYLDRFYHDLKSHRFAAIIVHKQNLDINSGRFSEEGNIWNKLVAYNLICEYEPILTLVSTDIQVLVPRETTKCH